MPAYIIAYDLHEAGQNYTCIIDRLKKYGTYCHLQQSVWIINTNQSAVQVRDNLMKCLDRNDKLFVGLLGGEAAWTGYPDNISNWLRQHLQ